jgi:hypothetical protein
MSTLRIDRVTTKGKGMGIGMDMGMDTGMDMGMGTVTATRAVATITAKHPHANPGDTTRQKWIRLPYILNKTNRMPL